MVCALFAKTLSGLELNIKCIAREIKIRHYPPNMHDSTLQLFFALSACQTLRPLRERKDHAKNAEQNHAERAEE